MQRFKATPALKPVLKWAGGKRSLLAQMVPYFPADFERFVEPFVGGGAVFFALEGPMPAWINDVNPELVNVYAVLRDHPRELMEALDALTSRYSEEHYYGLRTSAPASDVEAAARTVFLNKTGFNGLYRQNSRGEFNVPFGKRARCPTLYDRENVLAVARHLARTEITSRDFEDVLDASGAGDFVYCDPPYEPLSLTSSFNSYRAGGFSRDDQRRLKASCVRASARGARVAVSNSASPFIRELYGDADVRLVRARRAINSDAARRGAIDEVLVRIGYGAHAGGAPSAAPTHLSQTSQLS